MPPTRFPVTISTTVAIHETLLAVGTSAAHRPDETHTTLLQLNANGQNQKGIRDGCCLRTPMCGFV